MSKYLGAGEYLNLGPFDQVPVVIEAMDQAYAAGLLIRDIGQDRLLLFQRRRFMSQGRKWSPSFGRRKLHRCNSGGTQFESPLYTALREAKEELGPLPRGKLCKTPYVDKSTRRRAIRATYVLEVETDIANLIDPTRGEDFFTEVAKWGWFSRREITPPHGCQLTANNPDMILHPGLARMLSRYEF